MMKTLQKLILTVLMALVSASSYAYDFEVDGLYYNALSLSELTCEVTYGGTSPTSALYSGNITIPATVTYNGKTLSVTGIGDYAFQKCEKLAAVEIPNSVTSIGDAVFSGCKDLTLVDIPNSVTNIGRSVFADCTKLNSVNISNSVTDIGDETFDGCI